MKIKKVEIQAFRAYNRVEDCIFDFKRDDGQYADFVSIYAPNGFGKTSFYDAVEWGITNNIYRFIRNSQNRLYANDEKHLTYELKKDKSPQYILRNKNSSNDLEGFVRLHLSNPDDVKFRIIPKVLRKDSTDYEFEEKNTENKYFRDVILSQENIDAFLKEDNPELRYEKFMTFFGDTDLDHCYTNILQLLRGIDNKVSSLEKDLQAKQSEVPYDIDHKILEKINLLIDDIIKYGENFTTIQPDFTDNDFIDFTNRIVERQISLRNKLNEFESKLNQINEDELALDSYLSNLNRLNEINLKTEKLIKTKETFENIFKLKNDLENKSKEISTINDQLKRFESIKEILPRYLEVKNIIKESEKDITEKNKELDLHNSNIQKSSEDINKLNSQLSNYFEEIIKFESKLNEAPQISTDLSGVTLEINNLTSLVKSSSKLIEDCNIAFKVLDSNEKIITEEILQISNNNFPKSLNQDEKYKESLQNIEKAIDELKLHNIKLQSLELELSKIKLLNDNLKKLILLGNEIIKEIKTESCPLCNHKFDSYHDLANAIINNPTLNKQAQELFSEKSIVENQISESTQIITSIREEILNNKKTELQTLKDNYSKLVHTKNRFIIAHKENEEKLELAKTKRKEILTKLEGLDSESFRKKCEKELDSIKDLIQQTSTKLEQKSAEKKSLESKIDLLKKSITSLELKIKEYKLTKEIYEVESFIVQIRFNGNLTVEYIDSLILNLNKSLVDLMNQEIKCKNELTKLSNFVSQENESSIPSQMIVITNLQNEISMQIAAFERALISYFSAIPDKKDKNIFLDSFSSIKKQHQLGIEEIKNSLENLDKIEGYKQNVLPFLKYTRVQNEKNDIERKIQELRRLENSLLEEKNNLSQFINEQIQSFFYEELINNLYRKIDPHPEYKTIKFRCDFSGDKPKLNVFVNAEEDVPLIPNLYFSTAQINILSLSIFLAKALNAKDDKGESIDCIFIDDPIQSMDSINILSTIDLLRSIVVNLNKQIILSTHDENFHDLLQKKIPENLFKSKFLEFESFGIIKNTLAS